MILITVPQKEQLSNHWPLIKNVYSTLTDNKLNLDQQLKKVNRTGSQRFDIWFDKPFYFAIEFDESQHFNQFRNATLDFYEEVDIAFDLDLYRELTSRTVKPGKSGFQKLRREDPLFPEFLIGEKQDNRIRQRAFRDFLKDLLPIVYGYNPTVRLPYQLINKKKDFEIDEVEFLINYMLKNQLLPEKI